MEPAPSPGIDPLLRHRQFAARESGGTSEDIIYSLVLDLITRFDLYGDVLDFGAGIGSLSEKLFSLQRFESVHAIDLLPHPAEISEGIHWTSSDLNDKVPYANNSFDTVVAAEVFEHLENPRFVARELFRVLRPGGTLLLTTPNNESWRSLLSLVVRGHHVAFGERSYPAHITPLLCIDVRWILKEAGFSDPVFCYTNKGGLPGFPRTSWQKVSLGLLHGRRFSDNVCAVARKKAGCETSAAE
ncbi:MAG TPA: methyltransferase domain-containing protein [Terriglobales bacterium]|nr:methyltransferase domain-containing protein [Terriglobales bacterium]